MFNLSMKHINTLLVLALFASPAVTLAATPKEKAIKELFNLQKMERIGEQVMGQVIENFKAQVPENQHKKLAEVAKKELSTDDLSASLAKVYDQNLSEQELKDIIAFYKTPTGQKYIAVQPKLIGESTQQIQMWGMKYSERVQNKMGIKKK